MNDTLITQDMLMVDKITPRFTGYERGDIVIVKAPYEERKLYVKRVIGLPGETVELIDGNFYIDGQKLEERYTNVDYTYNDDKTLANYWKLGDDEYFIVGDNRIHNVSHDSRAFGPVSIENFVGQAFFRFYPFDSIGSLK